MTSHETVTKWMIKCNRRKCWVNEFVVYWRKKKWTTANRRIVRNERINEQGEQKNKRMKKRAFFLPARTFRSSANEQSTSLIIGLNGVHYSPFTIMNILSTLVYAASLNQKEFVDQPHFDSVPWFLVPFEFERWFIWFTFICSENAMMSADSVWLHQHALAYVCFKWIDLPLPIIDRHHDIVCCLYGHRTFNQTIVNGLWCTIRRLAAMCIVQ